MAALKIKLVRSPSGHTARHRQTLTGLGLTRIGTTRVVPDTQATRGMVNQVSYLLEWSETPEEFKPFGKRAAQKKAAPKAS
jgi:large subunit ribosomal protein L30